MEQTYKPGKYINVKLEQLIVNEENPRIIPANNEIEAIFSIIEDQKEKIYNIAEDIAIYGLSPMEIISAFPLGDNKYRVIEGNRRVTALKLLTDIRTRELLKGVTDAKDPKIGEKLHRKFENLINKIKRPIDNDIQIYTSDDIKYLELFMEKRHLGEDDGRGLVRWDRFQKDRYRQLQGERTPIINFLDELITNNYMTHDDAYKNINLTNWTRIFGLIGRSELKITFQDGKFYILDKALFEEKIKIVIVMLRHQPVKIVYDNESIREFFNDVNKTMHNILRDREYIMPISTGLFEKTDSDEPENDFEDNVVNKDTISNHSDYKDDGKEKKNLTVSGEHYNQNGGRRYVKNITLPEIKYLNLKITKIPKNEYGIHYLYNEIKKMSSSLQYREYPLAMTYLVRALFEQCMKYWCTHTGIPISNQNGRDIQLSDLIKLILRANPFVFFGNTQLDRVFKSEFDNNNSAQKEFLDIYMHHPSFFSGNYKSILHIINGPIFDVINFVLNNDIPN